MRRGSETVYGEAGHCAHCARDCPPGPDVCLGILPGVLEACCGHGWLVTPYLVDERGVRIEGREAIAWFANVNAGPPSVDTVTVRLFEQHDAQLVVEAEYVYETLDLIAVRWRNRSDVEPTWRFDGVEATLSRGSGTVPLPPLVCTLDPDGAVRVPLQAVEEIAHA